MIRQMLVDAMLRRLPDPTERRLRSSQTAVPSKVSSQATGDRARSQWMFLNNPGLCLPCLRFS